MLYKIPYLVMYGHRKLGEEVYDMIRANKKNYTISIDGKE